MGFSITGDNDKILKYTYCNTNFVTKECFSCLLSQFFEVLLLISLYFFRRILHFILHGWMGSTNMLAE